MTYKLGQNANFKNGGTTIQMGILHVLLNMLSISLLSRVHPLYPMIQPNFYIEELIQNTSRARMDSSKLTMF